MKIDRNRPMVMLEGGPRDRWWYYHDDLIQMREAAQHHLENGAEKSSDILSYVETEYNKQHPASLDAEEPLYGAIWRWASPQEAS